MTELSRYSVRSLSETKPSDRIMKCLITFCLGKKLAFTSSRFPTLIIVYPLSRLRLRFNRGNADETEYHASTFTLNLVY